MKNVALGVLSASALMDIGTLMAPLSGMPFQPALTPNGGTVFWVTMTKIPQ